MKAGSMVVVGSAPLAMCAMAAAGIVQFMRAPRVPTLLIHLSDLKKLKSKAEIIRGLFICVKFTM